MGQGHSLALGEPYDSEYNLWISRHCGDTGIEDLTSPLICNTASFRQLPYADIMNAVSMDYYLRWTYAVVRNNIIALCDAQNKPGDVQERVFQHVWPLFYHMYNSSDGKLVVDTELSKIELPQKAIDTIKNNYNEDIQRRFMVMNGAYSGVPMNYTRTILFSGWVKPTWVTNGEISGAVKKSLREQTLLETWTTKMTDPKLDRWGRFRRATGVDAVGRPSHWMEDPGGWGNPTWTHAERMTAQRRINPVHNGVNLQEWWTNIHIHTGLIPKDCSYADCFEPKYEAGHKGRFYDDPTYGGMEPKMVFGANPFAFPGSNTAQSGGAGRTYRNPCDARGPLETILPIAAAVVGIGVPYVFFGTKNISSHVLAITAGGTLYYAAQTFYGIDALLGIGNNQKAENGASFLAVGGPAFVVLFAHEYGLLDVFGLNLSTNNAYFAAGAAGVLGYFVLKDVIGLSLDIGGGITSILTAPLAFLETGIAFLVNGCAAQFFTARWLCTCNEAVETGGKKGIIEQFLGPIYGTTGQQAVLRKRCLELEMKRAGWASTDKTDDNVVSRCTGIQMENPYACYTAQNWAYKAPAIPSLPRIDAQEIDMWNQVSHCLDAENPSFFPPQTDLDKWCQSKHGEQFRAGPNGTCKNYALPGPNNTDPVGLQDPGAYKAQSEGCTIL